MNFLSDNLKLQENYKYMCPEFASEVTRYVHTTSQSITVNLNTLRKTKQCHLCKWTLTTAIFVHEKSRALQNTSTIL